MTIFGKVLIGLMLATAAVLVVRGNFISKEPAVSIDSTTDGNATTTPEVPLTNKFNGSIADLASRGGDYKCTFDQTTDVSHSTGTVMISGQRVRGDFLTEVKAVSGMKVESHMISDAGFVYTWSSMMPTGMKFKAADSSNASTTSASGVNYGEKLDYDCNPWTLDASVFTLPSGVAFTEIKS